LLAASFVPKPERVVPDSKQEMVWKADLFREEAKDNCRKAISPICSQNTVYSVKGSALRYPDSVFFLKSETQNFAAKGKS